MKTHPAGYALAALASSMLITAAVLSVGLMGYLLSASWGQDFFEVLKRLLASGPLPLFLYLVWALSIFGTGAAIVAITLYNFHALWFWRCLFVASLLWLFLPPLHTVIGIISLVLLLRFRRDFLEDTLNGHHGSVVHG